MIYWESQFGEFRFLTVIERVAELVPGAPGGGVAN
jgi:hypothetical protein